MIRSSSKPNRGWILYDDSCGFCRRWVPFWSATLCARGFEIAPLQSDWVRDHFLLPNDKLIHDLRLLLSDGTQIQGADVYRHVMRRIWWARAPLLRGVFDMCYRTFADNRFRFSRACRLQHNPPVSSDADPYISHR